MNILNYIISNNSKLEEINTLDAMILTRLSYLHLEDVTNNYPIKIKDLKKVLASVKTSHNDVKLIDLLNESKRFKDLLIRRIKYIEDKDKEEVFKAITIEFNNNIFIAFRGTGKNTLDFKEDMNMSYKLIPSCIDGVKYLEEEKNFNKLYISGHSKGGHIAIYVASHTTFFNKIRIEKVYNFDGPGFLEINNEFKKIQSKIINYYPESSIVGRLMNSVGKVKIIKTKKQGIEAHSVYNWEVNDNDLVNGEFTNNSNLFHEECLNLLNVIPKNEREDIINYIFNLMLKGELKNIKDLDLIKVKELINNMPHIEKNKKDELFKFFKLLIKCSMPEIKSKREANN